MIKCIFQDGLPFKGNKIWIFLCLDHRRKNALVLINPSKAYKPWVVLGKICREVSRFKLPKEVWEDAAWDLGDLGPTACSASGLLFDFSCINSSPYLCLTCPHSKMELWYCSLSKSSLVLGDEKCCEASAKCHSPAWYMIYLAIVWVEITLCKVVCQMLVSHWVSTPEGRAVLLNS